MLHGRIFDTNAHNFCRTAVFQLFEKLCESNNFVIIILKDYSSTIILIEREISVGWRRIVARTIDTPVYIYRS